MSLTIRKATPDDASALSYICLQTADAGVSAESLHDFGELPGLVYAVPYLYLPTTWGFVLVDGSEGVVGYVVGSTDTRSFEKHAAEIWWPPLADKYSTIRAVKPADIRYIDLLRKNPTAPETNVLFSPAHLHINIIEKYQKQGWGRRLIGTAVEHLRRVGLSGVWLGLDPRNDGARKFYGRLGFTTIHSAGGEIPDNNQMGLVLADFH